MENDTTDFISAGFLVTREIKRPPFVSDKLLPVDLYSASRCMAPFAPDTWCIEWTQDSQERRRKKAERFDLSPDDLEKLTAWITSRVGTSMRWPNVIMDSDTTRELVDLFLGGLTNLKVIELGLHRDLVDPFCQEAEPHQKPGFAPMGRQGVHEVILAGNLITPGGKVLGYEPLVFDHSLLCSWLCNGLETMVERSLGIKPNQYGLIGNFEDAMRSVTYISQENVPAEPGLWLPWLIVDQTENV